VPVALLAVLSLLQPGEGEARTVAPSVPLVVWLDAGGAEILEHRGAIGVHGLAGDGTRADEAPARFRIALDAAPGPPSLRLTLAGVPAAGGRDRDSLRGVPLAPLGDGRLATPWLVAVASEEDRRHPDLAGRALMVRADDRVEARVRRGGGRAVVSSRAVTRPPAEEGDLALRRTDLEAVVLRRGGEGPPVVGGDAAGAAEVMRFQFEVLGEVLAPCAVWAGPPEDVPVRVEAGAPAAMIAVGDPLGLPSSGGEVRLEIDGRKLPAIRVGEGFHPEETARLLAARIREAGFETRVSVNSRNPFAALSTADVVVLRPDGTPAVVRPWDGAPLASDRRQPVRVGGSGGGRGLDAFGANDFASGTVEERSLVKVFKPRRSGAIGVFVVDGLGDGSRQGQAFVGPVASPDMAGAVILDWRALRRTRQAYALPHEVVHVLLGDRGHTDEAGDPRPDLLMHSQAGSALDGPRRLTREQCRIIRDRLAEPGFRKPRGRTHSMPNPAWNQMSSPARQGKVSSSSSSS